MDGQWRIEMLGGLRAIQGDRVLTRFRTQKTGSLLAYLAYKGRRTPREVLCEMLWPDTDPEAARHSFCVALSSLRHQMEPSGVPRSAVIITDRFFIELNPAAFSSDTRDFEAALAAVRTARSEAERARQTARALDLYRGEFLHGYYDNWIIREQEYLSEQFLKAAHWLVGYLESTRDMEGALRYARHAVYGDAFVHEEMHRDLVRLLAETGQVAQAAQQYHMLERLLRERLGTEPAPATRALGRELERAETAHSPLAQPRASPATAPIAAPLPAGTVTFLLIGAEVGPAGDEERGAGPVATITSAMLREAATRHGGQEAPLPGGGIAATFPLASDALAAAVSLHRRLPAPSPGEEPEGAGFRLALHAGDVQVRDGRYTGPVPDEAAAMLAAAHPGQILCSEAVAVLARHDADVRRNLTDLGTYRLPGVESPERLFQVGYDAMRERVIAAPHAERAFADNLPFTLTRFFGRDKTQEGIRRLVQDEGARLVTLMGPGGCGKTRLALETARSLLPAFAGCVWFVPLVDVSDASRIGDVLQGVLRLPRSPHLDPLEQAAAFLARQPSLIVLDNCEHIAEGAAVVVRALLERAPCLTLLVTSRRALDLTGEREFPIAPLPVPGPDADLEQLSRCASVQMFVDRAQAVRPDFQLTERNAANLARLCSLLEGIPLAIELAAAQAQVMTLAQMLAQLEHRLDFLVSRRRDVALRHRTLRAAIDGSFQLLPADLRRFFTRLSVFRGGWAPEAAEAVCEEPSALDGLLYLEESSLIYTEESDGPMRFRILVTLAEYGDSQLEPEERGALFQRHARYYRDLAEEMAQDLAGTHRDVAMQRLQRDHDNLRAALDRATAGRVDAETGLRLAEALSEFWLFHGDWAEGRRRMEQVLALTDAAGHPLLRADVLRDCALLARRQGDFAASRALLEESLAICRTEGDILGMARCTLRLGTVAYGQGNLFESRRFYEESLAAFRQTADGRGLAMALNCLARFSCDDGDLARAQSLYEESLALMRGLGDQDGISNVLGNMGSLARLRGDFALARACYEESLALETQAECRGDVAWALMHLGELSADEGDLEKAAEVLSRSLALRRELGARSEIADTLERLADVERRRGDADTARALYTESLALHRELGQERSAAAALQGLGRVALDQGDTGRARSCFGEALETACRLGDMPHTAMALNDFAALALASGEEREAALLIAAMQALKDALRIPFPPEHRRRQETVLASLRVRLDGPAFAAASAEGSRLTCPEAVALALRKPRP